MRRSRRIVAAAFAVLVLAIAGCGGDEVAETPAAQPTDENVAEPPAAEPTPSEAPVIKLNDERFGDILATPGNRALYYWTVEKEADGDVRCTGSCAVAWPPLLVRSPAAVPRKIPGIRGTFGVIRRPGGGLQATHRGLPIYTYAHEGPNEVLCDDVDGWFVVRV